MSNFHELDDRLRYHHRSRVIGLEKEPWATFDYPPEEEREPGAPVFASRREFRMEHFELDCGHMLSLTEYNGVTIRDIVPCLACGVEPTVKR